MEIDTIDPIAETRNRYGTAHDPSKVDLNLSPRSRYNANRYSEDDNHSTSGDSTQSNDDECHDDYETPLSAPDSRRQSQLNSRGSPEDNQEARSRQFTSALNEDITSTSALPIPRLQIQSPDTPMESTTRTIPTPPAYIPDAQDISIFRHFRGPVPVQLIPEGTEPLPAYEAGIQISNVFLRKSEYHTLNTRCSDRKWHRCIATLTGTKLDIYAANRPFYRHLPTRPDLPYYVKQGSLLKSYSLQHAEIGLATDYLKRKFVLRLRVEAEQFLLSCTEIETLVEWMEKLTWGAAMALELDEREEVKETTLPRALRRRRRRTTPVADSTASAHVAMEAEDSSGAAGEERLRLQRSHTPSHAPLTIEEETAPDSELTVMTGMSLLDPMSIASSMASTPNISRAPTPTPLMDAGARLSPNSHSRTQSNTAIPFRSLPRTSIGLGRPHTSTGGRSGLALYPSTLSQSITNLAVPTPSASSTPTPSQSTLNLSKKFTTKKSPTSASDEADTKIPWQPRSRWSPSYDLAYAKKCMPALLRDARRKSCLVFHEGERQVVAMEKLGGKGGREMVMRRLERGTLCVREGREVEPPAYGV